MLVGHLTSTKADLASDYTNGDCGYNDTKARKGGPGRVAMATPAVSRFKFNEAKAVPSKVYEVDPKTGRNSTDQIAQIGNTLGALHYNNQNQNRIGEWKSCGCREVRRVQASKVSGWWSRRVVGDLPSGKVRPSIGSHKTEVVEVIQV